ncbi:MAG: histidine kinase [Bacteroidota bacterium]
MFLFKDTRLLFRCFKTTDERDSVFYYASKALDLAKAIKNPALLTEANLDMGDAYHLNRQYDRVKEYRQRALLIAQNNNLIKQLSQTHLKVGQSFMVLSKKRTKAVLDSAIYHTKKALSFAKAANYAYGIFDCTVVLSEYLNVNKQHKKALALMETVISLPKDQLPINYGYNASFYYANILKDNKRYEAAKIIAQGLLKSTPEKDFSRKKALNYFLSVLYAYNGQPDSTDYAIKQAITASNAQDVAKINARISALQAKYETKEKEQEIKILEQNEQLSQLAIQELQRQRLILGYGLLIPIIMIFAGGWYMNRRRLKVQLETEQKEHALKMSELKALHSQMNPHFIFNALNSIQEYIFSNDKTLASSYLVKFSRLIRLYLEHSRVFEISIAKEIEALKLYLDLENSRLNHGLDYTIDVDEKLDTSKTLLPPLFIQPYVENAIKHGLLHKKGPKKLTVAFYHNTKDQTLDITIEDNGIGVQASKAYNKNKPYTSFATNANEHRLELMNFKRAKKIRVTVTDLENDGKAVAGTSVIISIPF